MTTNNHSLIGRFVAAGMACLLAIAAVAEPVLLAPVQTPAEVGVEYSEDLGRDVGYMTLTWNLSGSSKEDNMVAPATGFGSNQGLVEIVQIDSPYTIWPSLEYEIHADSSEVSLTA